MEHNLGSTATVQSSHPVRRVLVVDDEPQIRMVLRLALERDGFLVTETGDGGQALEVLGYRNHDLVLLDVNLPSMRGFDVLVQIRKSNPVPVILVTGCVGETDLVLGLELGADDYVVKPFSRRELLSRVRAVLRRSSVPVGPSLDFDGLRIDEVSRQVFLSERVVDLTPREFDLLLCLASSPRRVFSRSELLTQVWRSSDDWQDPATVTEHVRRLRSKLEPDRVHPRWIRTVRAVGYAFEP